MSHLSKQETKARAAVRHIKYDPPPEDQPDPPPIVTECEETARRQRTREAIDVILNRT